LSETWKKVKLPRRLGEPARQLAAELHYELPPEDQAPATPPAEGSILELQDAATIARLIERAKQLSPTEVQAMLEELEKNP
jgi:hypothetical protein